MKEINLLDCTLRDGGYVNDWLFGQKTIKGFCAKIAQTGVEMVEVGFIKGDEYDPNKSVFPDIVSIKDAIQPKHPNVTYLGMLDMSAPIPMERITPCDGTSIDGIRVIFKKNKIDIAYSYCEWIQKQGYKLFVNFVGTDLYTDQEFIEAIHKFNQIKPYAMSIVDSFGLIKRKHFLRLVYLADNNMDPDIALCYHAHNNLQQAFGNAESLVEMNLKRTICIDACVFGMGRGAGNLNLELFAEYMNENYDTLYRIEPMLEIMDEYLNVIYREKFWGYSLPLYLSASNGCHPNFAIYLAKKDSLSVKSFNELLRSIPKEKKPLYSKELAEKFYQEYQNRFVEDKEAMERLANLLDNRKVLLLAPGKSIIDNHDAIEKIKEKEDRIVIAVNFNAEDFNKDFVFCGNNRRVESTIVNSKVPCIVTSNVNGTSNCEYIFNYASYTSQYSEITDNSGLMLLRILQQAGVKDVALAGFDGYSDSQQSDFINNAVNLKNIEEKQRINCLISSELAEIAKWMKITFVTPSNYKI